MEHLSPLQSVQCPLLHLLSEVVREQRPLPPAAVPPGLGAPHAAAAATITAAPAKALARLSVVVPARNESAGIKDTLRSLGCARWPEMLEVILVDAGSRDDTQGAARQAAASSARPLDLRIVSSTSGRGGTLNAGAAAAARPDVLLFCHADTRLPEGYDRMVRSALEDPSVIAGAFSFGVDRARLRGPEPWGMRVVEYFANLRSRFLQLPYGDQALFLRADTFHAVGRFADIPLMEDLDLVTRLQAEGAASGRRIVTLEAVALCSPRRWEDKGVVVNTVLNQAFVVAYKVFGLSAESIYRLYYGEPPSQKP